MNRGVKERTAAELNLPACPDQVGPIWKLGGETCGCVLPAGHGTDHECSCGAWWAPEAR